MNIGELLREAMSSEESLGGNNDSLDWAVVVTAVSIAVGISSVVLYLIYHTWRAMP